MSQKAIIAFEDFSDDSDEIHQFFLLAFPQWILRSGTDPAKRANLLNEPPETVDNNYDGQCFIIVAVNFGSHCNYCWVENPGDALPFVFQSKARA